jgi:hypothetical protein
MGLVQELREEAPLEEQRAVQVYLSICSLMAALETPSPKPRRGELGSHEQIRAVSVVEEPRIVKVRICNDSGPSPCYLWTYAEPMRTRRRMRKVLRRAEHQGWSRRKPSRLESLRVRNSSGSLTA